MSKKGLVRTIGITFEWKKEDQEGKYWTLLMPVRFPHGEGIYEIHVSRRPPYCDRGDWIIHVQAYGCSGLDGQDGFPRYFFGSDREAMEQMELWCMRRQEVKDAL